MTRQLRMAASARRGLIPVWVAAQGWEARACVATDGGSMGGRCRWALTGGGGRKDLDCVFGAMRRLRRYGVNVGKANGLGPMTVQWPGLWHWMFDVV